MIWVVSVCSFTATRFHLLSYLIVLAVCKKPPWFLLIHCFWGKNHSWDNCNVIRKIKEIHVSNNIWKNFIFLATNSSNLAWFGYSLQLYTHFWTKNLNSGSKVDFRKSIFFSGFKVSLDNFVESMPSCVPKLKIKNYAYFLLPKYNHWQFDRI